jgi:hypothetical protein
VDGIYLIKKGAFEVIRDHDLIGSLMERKE